MIMTRPRRVRWSGGDSSESKATNRTRQGVRTAMPYERPCRPISLAPLIIVHVKRNCRTRTSFVKFSLSQAEAGPSQINGNGTVPSRRSLCRSGVRFQPPMATGMPARCQLKPSVQHLGYSLSLALDTLSLSFLFHPLSSFIIYFLFNAGCVHNARLCFPAPEERRCSAPSSSARLLGVR